MKGRHFRARLGFALAGLRLTWRDEASFRAQAGGGAALVLALAAVRPGALWTAVLLVAAGLVLVAETLNTAIERLCDTLHPHHAAGIGATKDIAAAASLIAATVAAAAGGACLYSVFS